MGVRQIGHLRASCYTYAMQCVMHGIFGVHTAYLDIVVRRAFYTGLMVDDLIADCEMV